MAVHVPLSRNAQREAHEIMASNVNILKPSAGEPVVSPTQDMVLGCFFLTLDLDDKLGEGKVFADFQEVIWHLDCKNVHLQAKIRVRHEGEILETTPGRVLFNQNVVLPAGLNYKNYTFGKKELKNLVAECFNEQGTATTGIMVDAIKDIGFKYATLSGITISVSDMIIPEVKDEDSKSYQESFISM